MSTNKELTARYNELANKTIKPGSYSNAKLTTMIEVIEAEAIEAAEFEKAQAEDCRQNAIAVTKGETIVAKGAYDTAREAEQRTGHKPARKNKPKRRKSKQAQKNELRKVLKEKMDAPKTESTAKPVAPAKHSAAQILAEFKIEAKQGRALLRRNNIDRNSPAAIRTFLKKRAK